MLEWSGAAEGRPERKSFFFVVLVFISVYFGFLFCRGFYGGVFQLNVIWFLSLVFGFYCFVENFQIFQDSVSFIFRQSLRLLIHFIPDVVGIMHFYP